MNYLAFDIGGTNIKYGLVDSKGCITDKKIKNTPQTYKSLLSFILEIVDLSPKIAGVCISSPGIYNPVSEKLISSSALEYIIGKPFVNDLNKLLNLPVSIENDGNCAILGEYWLGNGMGSKSSVMFVIGSAVGGSILLNGKLLRGANLNAGELGYMLIDNHPEIKLFKSIGGKIGFNGLLNNLNMKNTSGEDLFHQITINTLMKKKYKEQLFYLGAGIVNIQYILDPEVVLIGGAVSSNPLFVELLNEVINEILDARPNYKVKPNLKISKYGNDANLLGAVYKYLYYTN